MIKSALIGYTGFVGSNLAQQGNFDLLVNRKNNHLLLNHTFDLVYVAAIPSLKHWANANPEKDLQQIRTFLSMLKQIKTKQLVFISTVDVFKYHKGWIESFEDLTPLEAYGANRYLAEKEVRKAFPNALIVRLPSLFGNHIKKNLIRDFLIPYPSMLRQDIYDKICKKLNRENLHPSYQLDETGFYQFTGEQDEQILAIIENLGYGSLSYTDSRSSFQFYNLEYLFSDCQKALDSGERILNLLTPPLSGEEIAREVFHKNWKHHLSKQPLSYDLKSHLYPSGYICSKEDVLNDLKNFVKEVKNGN